MGKYIKNRGRAYEDELERAGLYGRKQPGSGNRWYAKNDLTSDLFHTEAKSTSAEVTYSLHKADLVNLHRNSMGKIPIFLLDFSGNEYTILRREDFEGMILSLEYRDSNGSSDGTTVDTRATSGTAGEKTIL